MIENKHGGDLMGLPTSVLDHMQDVADQNGYSRGYPLGSITVELARRRRQREEPSKIATAGHPVIVRPVSIVPTADQIVSARYPLHARWLGRNTRSRC